MRQRGGDQRLPLIAGAAASSEVRTTDGGTEVITRFDLAASGTPDA